MSTAQNGQQVQVHYTGKLNDGSVFDSSLEREPLAFEIGGGQLLPAFENAIVGMTVGDKKTIHISAAEGYGEYNDEQVATISRQQVPPDMELKIGDMLQLQGPGGIPMPVKVIELTDESVTLDANHFLAGKDLTFDLELVQIG